MRDKIAPAADIEGEGNNTFMSDTHIEHSIEENAAGPKKASGDAGAIEQHSLTDQIAADKHLASKRAMHRKGLGVKLIKLSPSNTV